MRCHSRTAPVFIQSRTKPTWARQAEQCSSPRPPRKFTACSNAADRTLTLSAADFESRFQANPKTNSRFAAKAVPAKERLCCFAVSRLCIIPKENGAGVCQRRHIFGSLLRSEERRVGNES